ncbi:MAG: arsenic efflux protein [Firmicutes bacterium]|nr:arsenic efflux protein [Bacillota bacterium]
MNESLWAIILTSAEDSFIEVTAFVGAILLLFSYIDYKRQETFVNTIAKSEKYQPLIGSLLGIIPGCGGSILVMPLYVKGTVTFGTVVATLIATTGDSAFILLTQTPRDFLIITPICFIVGAAVGYIVDYYKIGAWLKKRTTRRKIADLEREHREAEALLDELYHENPIACRSCSLRHLGHEEGDEVDMILHHENPLDPGKLGYRITHSCYIIFWIMLAAGFVLGVMDLMQIDINRLPGLPDAGILIGGTGTLITLLFMFCSKKVIQAQTHEDTEHKIFSLKEAFAHNAQETAFVGTWVFAAYLIYELGVYLAGGEQIVTAMMISTGLTAVLLGALVGIIPGCGPQVIFVSLYIKGIFPFAALLANAISQDGDALFPLIAMDRKAAFWATVFNTLAALAIGIAAFLIENKMG